MKTLWLVSGGIEAVPGIERAKELGYRVVVSDGSPDAPGKNLADHFIIASTYDVKATVDAAIKYNKLRGPINGVCSVAADVPKTVAAVSKALKLPGLSIDSARLSSDKVEMKERFASCGVPIPWFSPVGTIEQLQDIANERGFPLVLKPVDSRGARGVILLTEESDLEWCLNHSSSVSPTGRTMVEEFLQGPQVSTETFLFDDGYATPGFVDRNYDLIDTLAPFIIENGGHQPTVLSREEREAISQCAARAGRALGVSSGVVKGDMVLTEEGPKVIEVALRLSGGWLSTDQIPLGTGVDLVGAVFRLALGEHVRLEEVTPRYEKGVAIRYFFPTRGRIREVLNVEKAKNIEWVHRIEMFLKEGDLVGSQTDHTTRAGCVITVGTDREEAVARAKEVIEMVKFKVEETD